MGRKTSSRSVSWHDIAAVRARDVRLRLVYCLFIALAAGFAAPGVGWPLAWLAATVSAQLLSLAITEPMRRDPAFRVSPGRERAFFASIALSSAVFASCGALFWFSAGGGGRLFAMVILAGGAVNVALQAGGSARLLWIGCAPFIVSLQALPAISFLSASGPERDVMGMTALAATLFVSHLIAAGRQSLANARQVDRALHEARREHRRADAASAAKNDFLGVMSHELRTPLNGILGMTQALEGDDLTEEQRARIDVIHRSGDHLLLLLNDVLDISKIESAKLELAHEVVDVVALAAQAEKVFGPLAAAKGLSFELRYLPSAGARRWGDANRLRQVLHNLLGNAVKFTEVGGVTVVISGDGDQLVFQVADTGPGMAPERLDGLFELFDQSDASATRRYGGSGLGLGIARGLTRLMNGDVTVRSEPGRGSTFTAQMTLPPAREGLVSPLARAAPAAFEPPRAIDDRLRVLAAEDNVTNQLVLKTLLEQIGVEVHLVSNGAEAIEAWRTAHWDVVLMDIRMPGVDGAAATRAIRALEASETRPRTPIIAVTADAVSGQAADYRAAGMDGLVPKPIQLNQLISMIETVLAGERAVVADEATFAA